jgi:hypothetical protein
LKRKKIFLPFQKSWPAECFNQKGWRKIDRAAKKRAV